jgi:hypothetical protein
MRKKITFDPQLIKEEAKRFKLLTEYDFYPEENVIAPSGNPQKPIILGNELGNELEEAEEEPVVGNEQDPEGFDQAGEMEDDTPVDIGAEEMPAPEGGEEMPAEEPIPAPEGGEEMPAEEPMPAEEMPIEEPMPAEDEVEVDVTSIVKGAEEAKEAAIRAMKVSKSTGEELMSKLANLEAKLAKMDSVASKIEGLEKEIVKRNPTPVEKLEMRSLSSFPYNIKLSDYWSDKEGAYDVMGNKDKEKEYVLTKDDIDDDYSYSQIQNSFDKPSEEQGYEEEDI